MTENSTVKSGIGRLLMSTYNNDCQKFSNVVAQLQTQLKGTLPMSLVIGVLTSVELKKIFYNIT